MRQSGVSVALMVGIGIGDYPKVAAWWERVSARESWQKVNELAAPILAQMG